LELRHLGSQFRRHRAAKVEHPIPNQTHEEFMSIFDEKYRVVGIENDRLHVRGVHTGDVLTILNPQPEFPISQEDYPVGKLIALSDPSEAVPN
jgi:hypothetical protein